MHVAKLTFFTWFSVGLIRECNYRIHVFFQDSKQTYNWGASPCSIWGNPPRFFFRKSMCLVVNLVYYWICLVYKTIFDIMMMMMLLLLLLVVVVVVMLQLMRSTVSSLFGQCPEKWRIEPFVMAISGFPGQFSGMEPCRNSQRRQMTLTTSRMCQW